MEFLDLPLYPWKIQRKQDFTLVGNSAELWCDTLGNSNIENQHPWKFHMSFSWTPLEIPLLPIDPWNFLILSVWKQCNRSQKHLQNIYMCWEKEIYFLYMWSSKRVKKYPLPPHTSLPESHPQLSAKLPKISWDLPPPPSLWTQWHLRYRFFSKKILKKALVPSW